MGILNLTPDSYYEPSRYDLSVFDSSADIIDIGAVSSRPGASDVDETEEWNRLRPVLEYAAGSYPGRELSIDTFRSTIVRKAYDIVGPFIVNDISAGDADSAMLATVSSLGLKYVAMHHGASLKGSDAGVEGDVVGEVKSFFRAFSEKASRLGIDWILDPGFGFGKTLSQNWELLHRLDEFSPFGREVFVSISRKSMVYRQIGSVPESEETLEATESALLEAVHRGATILRVHDVDHLRKAIFGFL